MARPGRPRNHDPIADDIRQCIRNAEDEAAKAFIVSKDINVLDGEACTPLIWASFHNRPDLLTWLINRGANVNHQGRI